MMSTLDITPSPRLLQVLGEIPLAPWQCVAELVDNSLDELLKEEARNADNPLTVDIEIESGASDETFLIVRDNGLGMNREELERSLRAGHSAKNRYGSLGLFGMGFNIATARLGTVTTVTTTRRGTGELLEATIDFADIEKRESFSVPVSTSPCDKDLTGTTVRIRLKRDIAESLRRPKTHKTLMSQLGDVYTYLLRDEVPGLSRAEMSSRTPALIRFNGDMIEPKLPCVWSDERSVTSYGQAVPAILYVDKKLTPATACLDCGYWDTKNGPDTCEECGSQNLEVRERRIWGWLGIQRYIDSQDYGIDFIRYGRKILKHDKSIFTYTDPDTLKTEAEYPVEMPANQGRIVGEIHLDHVPVTYQKNDFDRQSRGWQVAVEEIRGAGPLKPRRSDEANDSPLARLFTAYRRNDAGLKCLIPGSGESKQGVHVKAREWAGMFDKGVARFRDDTEWYEAARRHDELRNRAAGESGEHKPGQNETADAYDDLVGDGAPETVEGTDRQKPAPTRESDQLEAARLMGTRRQDLSGRFKLGKTLGEWDLTIYVTRSPLLDSSGQETLAIPGVIKGNAIEVFVWGEHAVFTEYGRDVRDVALMQAASLIRELSKADASPTAVYGELVQEITDLRSTSAQILERIEHLLDRIRELALPAISQDADDYWSALDAAAKTRIEERCAVKFSTSHLAELVADGQFVSVCDAFDLATLIRHRPGGFFDGAVFSPALASRQGDARNRIVASVTQALESMGSFNADEMMREKYDVQLVSISMDSLDEKIVSEEFIS